MKHERCSVLNTQSLLFTRCDVAMVSMYRTGRNVSVNFHIVTM